MVNCQSWSDTTLELATDKINVLCADNNSGKSVLFKMLKIAVCKDIYTKEERKALIRYGATHATIMFLFDDGSIGITDVFSNRVLYRYSEDGKTFKESLDEPITEVTRKLGVLVNSDSSFIANIIDMDQPLLLINTKERENYELIKMLVTDKDLEVVQERIENLQSEFKTRGQDLKIKVLELDDELSRHTYTDIEQLERNLAKAELEYGIYNTFVDAYFKLTYLESNFREDPGYDRLISMVDMLTTLTNIADKVKRIEIKPDVDESAIHVVNYFMGLKDSLSKLRVPENIDFSSIDRCMTIAEHVNNLSICLDSVKIIEDRDYSRLSNEYQVLEELQNLMSILSVLIPVQYKDYETMGHELAILEKLDSFQKRVDSQYVQLNKIAGLEEAIDKFDKKISTFDDVIDGCPVYGKVIYRNGKCVLDNN